MSKSYWDLSERQRAALTYEQAEQFVPYELMAAGVVRPPHPPVLETPETPTLERVSVSAVRLTSRWGGKETEIAFPTIEEAEAFLRLHPLRIASDYDAGSKVEYAEPYDQAGASIEMQRPVEYQSFHGRQEQLKRAETIRRANEKALNEYADAERKAGRATQDLWKDWNAMREKAARCQAVRDTLSEYTALTGGDLRLALTFLAKAYSQDRRKDAEEWFDEPFGADMAVPAPTTDQTPQDEEVPFL